MLIRMKIKVICIYLSKLVNAGMAHSLSHRSKHRKMLLISVCDGEAPPKSVMPSSARHGRPVGLAVRKWSFEI